MKSVHLFSALLFSVMCFGYTSVEKLRKLVYVTHILIFYDSEQDFFFDSVEKLRKFFS